MSDKYTKAVQYLRENPQEIFSAWVNGANPQALERSGLKNNPGSVLFQPAGNCKEDASIGCLTMIRIANGKYRAVTPELTLAIRADTKLPSIPSHITVDHLPVFAKWMRKLKANPVTAKFIV